MTQYDIHMLAESLGMDEPEKQEFLTEDWGYVLSANTGVISEASGKSSDSDTMYLEGILVQADVVNGNKRLYPKRILENAINKYIKEQVETHQALGELNHPGRPIPNPREAAIIVEKLWWEGNNVFGKLRVLNTDAGKAVKALVEGGWIPCASSRGLGRVEMNSRGINEVQDGFRLTVVTDIVWGQSAPDAKLVPVFESNNTESVKKTDHTVKSIEQLTRNLKKLYK